MFYINSDSEVKGRECGSLHCLLSQECLLMLLLKSGKLRWTQSLSPEPLEVKIIQNLNACFRVAGFYTHIFTLTNASVLLSLKCWASSTGGKLVTIITIIITATSNSWDLSTLQTLCQAFYMHSLNILWDIITTCILQT